MTKNSKIIRHGLVCYEREEKYNCWSCERDIGSQPHDDLILAYHEVDIDDYPNDCTETYLLIDGSVYYKEICFFPEYITAYCKNMRGELSDQDLEYEKSINDDSFGALYDDFESFWKDPLTITSSFSCKLTDKLFYYCSYEFNHYIPSNINSIAWEHGLEISIMWRKPELLFTIDNYTLWFKIIKAFHLEAKKQEIIYVFYPNSVIVNQRISVLAFVDDVKKEIQWNHGKRGLTHKIFEILFNNE